MREDDRRSAQRSPHAFFRCQHIEEFSPAVRKVMNNVEKEAQKTVALLNKYLLLRRKTAYRQPLLESTRRMLEDDKFLGEVIAVLRTDTTPVEKLQRINQLCQQDANQKNVIVLAVKEIVKNPTQVSDNNWLKQLRENAQIHRAQTSRIRNTKKPIEADSVAAEKALVQSQQDPAIRRKTVGIHVVLHYLKSLLAKLQGKAPVVAPPVLLDYKRCGALRDKQVDEGTERKTRRAKRYDITI